MIKLLWSFLWDETAAIGLIRSACLGIGTAQMSGALDPIIGELPVWIGIALVSMGGFIRSSSSSKVKARERDAVSR